MRCRTYIATTGENMSVISAYYFQDSENYYGLREFHYDASENYYRLRENISVSSEFNSQTAALTAEAAALTVTLKELNPGS